MKQSDRWKELKAAGAREQRPLWASTGVKDPKYADDRYVVELAAPRLRQHDARGNTRSRQDHGNVHGDTVSNTGADAQRVFDDLADVGVDLPAVFVGLEEEGVEKFVEAWDDLIETSARRSANTSTKASPVSAPVHRWLGISRHWHWG